MTTERVVAAITGTLTVLSSGLLVWRIIGVRAALCTMLAATFAPQWVRSSALLWVERADQQLYRAKSEGRNRACLEQPAVSLVSAEEKGLLFGTSQFQDLA